MISTLLPVVRWILAGTGYLPLARTASRTGPSQRRTLLPALSCGADGTCVGQGMCMFMSSPAFALAEHISGLLQAAAAAFLPEPPICAHVDVPLVQPHECRSSATHREDHYVLAHAVCDAPAQQRRCNPTRPVFK